MGRKIMRFAENLKINRDKNGFTQEQIANHVHVVRQTVSNWENGIASPDIKILADLSELFNVSTDILLFGKTEHIEEHIELVDINEIYSCQEQDYIRKIKRKGFYDVLKEDIQTFSSIIEITFAHIMGIVKELKEIGYNICSIYGNGFSIYFSSDEEAKRFSKDLYNIINEFIHYDVGQTAFIYTAEIVSRVQEIERTIVNQMEKEIYGAETDKLFYWIDEDDRIRGYGKTKEDCIQQAKSQECLYYDIFHG